MQLKLNVLLRTVEDIGHFRFVIELLTKQQRRNGDVFVKLVVGRTDICDLHFTVDNCLYAYLKC